MRSPVNGIHMDSKFRQHHVSCDWESLLLLGGRDIDLEPTFSRSKVQALKKMVSRLPEKSSYVTPQTPRTVESNKASRRLLKKFGECTGQELGVCEKNIVNDKMPRVKVEWEPKFANVLPQTPRKNRRSIRKLNIKLMGGNPQSAGEQEIAPSSPRTPRKQIRCRHCGGEHWSHRCSNKKRPEETQKKEETMLKDLPPTEPGPKKKKYKFDFKVRKEGFKRRGNPRWVASPRYTSNESTL